MYHFRTSKPVRGTMTLTVASRTRVGRVIQPGRLNVEYIIGLFNHARNRVTGPGDGAIADGCALHYHESRGVHQLYTSGLLIESGFRPSEADAYLQLLLERLRDTPFMRDVCVVDLSVAYVILHGETDFTVDVNALRNDSSIAERELDESDDDDDCNTVMFHYNDCKESLFVVSPDGGAKCKVIASFDVSEMENARDTVTLLLTRFLNTLGYHSV